MHAGSSAPHRRSRGPGQVVLVSISGMWAGTCTCRAAPCMPARSHAASLATHLLHGGPAESCTLAVTHTHTQLVDTLHFTHLTPAMDTTNRSHSKHTAPPWHPNRRPAHRAQHRESAHLQRQPGSVLGQGALGGDGLLEGHHSHGAWQGVGCQRGCGGQHVNAHLLQAAQRAAAGLVRGGGQLRGGAGQGGRRVST